MKLPMNGFCVTDPKVSRFYASCHRTVDTAIKAAEKLAKHNRHPINVVQMFEGGSQFLGSVYPRGGTAADAAYIKRMVIKR